MARKLQTDKWLFLAVVVLVVMGVVMVYSASGIMAADLYLTKQLMWAALGVTTMLVLAQVDYRLYRQERLQWMMLGGTGLLLLLVLLMPPINGARRWFGIGGLGMQPSELAKLVAVFFTAAVLERRMHRINELKYALLPIALVVGGMVGLILAEPDLGTSVTLLMVVGTMVFAAGLSYRYLLGAVLLALPALYVLVWLSPYRRARYLAFLDPWADRQDTGYQIIQSLVAIGTGGVTGKGLMAGVQKHYYLPEPHTDFIFSVIAEETGLVGATLVVLCFCAIAWRGLRAAVGAPDAFGSLLAIGLTMMVALQAFINISVTTALLPTKGITLPLVSSGGSSLLVNLVAMGVLLNISQHAVGRATRPNEIVPGPLPAPEMGAA